MNLDKIFYLLTSFLFTLGVAFAVQRPNVIFLMVDDLGWTDFGCYGSDYYETPNIDKLAASGMKFTNGYAACRVCSPTSVALKTSAQMMFWRPFSFAHWTASCLHEMHGILFGITPRQDTIASRPLYFA